MKQLQIEKVLTYGEALQLHRALYNEEKRLINQQKKLTKKGLSSKHLSSVIYELQSTMFKLNYSKCKEYNW